MYALIFQRLLTEAILDFFYFPIWWYTLGAVRAGEWCFHLLQFGNDRLSPGVWMKNLFVPMFGQYDFEGRVISFFMRFVQIIIRSAALLVWAAFCILLFGIWFIIPIVVFYGLFKAIF